MFHKTDIAAIAFNMFRDWTKNVRKQYPKLNLTIVDETILVNDLVKTIKSARNSLFLEEKKEKRVIEGYDIGFMLGFIRSYLNEIWINDYIFRQSSSYKEFIALKAIKVYLEKDDLTAIRIRDIYKQLLTEGINFIGPVMPIAKINLTGFPSGDGAVFPDNEILQMLENKINRYVNDFLKSNTVDFMEPAEAYFSENEIEQIILADLDI